MRVVRAASTPLGRCVAAAAAVLVPSARNTSVHRNIARGRLLWAVLIGNARTARALRHVTPTSRATAVLVTQGSQRSASLEDGNTACGATHTPRRCHRAPGRPAHSDWSGEAGATRCGTRSSRAPATSRSRFRLPHTAIRFRRARPASSSQRNAHTARTCLELRPPSHPTCRNRQMRRRIHRCHPPNRLRSPQLLPRGRPYPRRPLNHRRTLHPLRAPSHRHPHGHMQHRRTRNCRCRTRTRSQPNQLNQRQSRPSCGQEPRARAESQ